MNLFADALIRMVVAFVAGELARRLLPVSRRFVPEPVQLSCIVTSFSIFGSGRLTVNGWLPEACLHRALDDAIRSAIRSAPVAPRWRMWSFPICSICCGQVGADIVPVHQVTLETRLRRPAWPSTSSFRVFIRDRIEIVDMLFCRSCRKHIEQSCTRLSWGDIYFDRW